MEGTSLIIIGISSAIGGFIAFRIILAILPTRLSSQSKKQAVEIFKEAERQKLAILKSKSKQLDDEIELASEELESEILQLSDALVDEDKMIESRKQEVIREESKLKKLESEVNAIEKNVLATKADFEATFNKLNEHSAKLVSGLEKAANAESDLIKNQIKSNLVDARQLECQRVLKTLNEEMSSSAKKKAQAILDRTHSRYAPDFAWPKNTNLVESENFDKLQSIIENGQAAIEELKELAGIEIAPITSSKDQDKVVSIKVAGGFGIHREAARLTISELIKQHSSEWGKARQYYEKHAARLDR